MKTFVNVLFEENYPITLFMLFIGLLGLVIYLVKTNFVNNEICKKTVLIVIGISMFFGIGVILREENVWGHNYNKSLKPQDNSCLVEVYKNIVKDAPEEEINDNIEIFINTTQYLHYFENKQVVVFDDVATKDEVAYHIGVYAPKIFVTIGSSDGKISESIMEEVYSNTNHLKKDGRLFLLDKSWKSSDQIICTQVGDQVYFMTRELYDSALNNTSSDFYLSEKDIEMQGIEYLDKERGESDVWQIVIALALFFIGWGVCILSFKNENKLLSVFMAFPVGTFLATTLAVGLLSVGIPLRKIVIIAAFLLVLLAEGILFYKNRYKLDVKFIAKVILVFVAVACLLTYLKMYYVANDSKWKIYYGVILAEYGCTGAAAFSDVSFGMLEPIMHGIAWKMHADWLYTMYPLMFLSDVGMLCTGVYSLSKNNNSKWMKFVIIICCTMLLSNYDFLLYSNTVHANTTVGCAIFIIILSYIAANKSEKTYVLDVISVVSAVAISISRVEGCLYVILALALLCGLNKIQKDYKKSIIVTSIAIVLWQGVLILYSKQEDMFWSPSKGIICIGGAVALILWILLLNIPHKVITWIKSRAYMISIVVFCIAVLMALFSGEITGTMFTVHTMQTFARHFGTSYHSNSGGFWCFVVLLIPLLVTKKKKENAFLLVLVFDYLCLVYLIFVFRKDYSIHELERDSCRRVISQIMPTMMFAVSYILAQFDMDYLWTKEG